MSEPTKRYRIELYTDRQFRWFAQIETFVVDAPSPACEWTAKADTWHEALSLASLRIVAKSSRERVGMKLSNRDFEERYAAGGEARRGLPETSGTTLPSRVFTNCNVCGIALRTEDEDQMGMCERCADE